MFPDYDFIKMLYGWNAVKPSIEWYVEHGNITAEQYKTITGKAYVSTEA